MMTRTFFTLWLSALFLVGCAEKAPEPLDPVWGKQPCAHCSMILSEPEPTAQAVYRDGSRKYFDDIGCLVEHLVRAPEGSVQRAWVRRHDAAGWIDAYSARYSAGHRTPMDHGILAAAEGFDFAAVRARVTERAAARRQGDAP